MAVAPQVGPASSRITWDLMLRDLAAQTEVLAYELELAERQFPELVAGFYTLHGTLAHLLSHSGLTPDPDYPPNLVLPKLPYPKPDDYDKPRATPGPGGSSCDELWQQYREARAQERRALRAWMSGEAPQPGTPSLVGTTDTVSSIALAKLLGAGCLRKKALA